MLINIRFVSKHNSRCVVSIGLPTGVTNVSHFSNESGFYFSDNRLEFWLRSIIV